MSWIGQLGAGTSAAAGVWDSNANKTQWNDYYERMYGPAGINASARQFNPWIWDAIEGKMGTEGTQFQTDMYNIAQGKDISPYLLNQPLNQINRGADTNMARLQSQIGRSNMGGGMAQSYALSNQMGKQNATANLYQNYGQWREQQRRADMAWLMSGMQKSQDQAQTSNTNIANSHTFHKSRLAEMQAFGQGYSAAGGGGDGPDRNAPERQQGGQNNSGTQDSFGNTPSDNNSNTGYQDTMRYPYGQSGMTGGESTSGVSTGSSGGMDVNAMRVTNPYASSGNKSSIQASGMGMNNTSGLNSLYGSGKFKWYENNRQNDTPNYWQSRLGGYTNQTGGRGTR